METAPSYFDFRLLCGGGKGPRRGEIIYRRGKIQTPSFFPVGTLGTVKGITPEELFKIGIKGMLMNAYHIYLRLDLPQTVEKAGGIHSYTGFHGFIITDSGGFQIKSLSRKMKVREEGIYFSSSIDGTVHFFSPELAIELQERLDSDIKLPLDFPVPYPAHEDEERESTYLTLRWLERAKKAEKKKSQVLFPIIQGGFRKDLRREFIMRVVEVDFKGYAIGGLSVGEPKELTFELLDYSINFLPSDRIRYLMGMGKPQDLVRAVEMGVDIFDCVIPTREARNGTLYTWTEGKISIRNSSMKNDMSVIDPECGCYACKNGISRSFLSHLYRSKEMLALRLLSLHNLTFYAELMERMRRAIEEGKFDAFKSKILKIFEEEN